MINNALTSWKSTVAGALAAAILIGYYIYTKQPIPFQAIVTAIGFLGLGSVVKDGDVTGGTRGQESSRTALYRAGQAPADVLNNPPVPVAPVAPPPPPVPPPPGIIEK